MRALEMYSLRLFHSTLFDISLFCFYLVFSRSCCSVRDRSKSVHFVQLRLPSPPPTAITLSLQRVRRQFLFSSLSYRFAVCSTKSPDSHTLLWRCLLVILRSFILSLYYVFFSSILAPH